MNSYFINFKFNVNMLYKYITEPISVYLIENLRPKKLSTRLLKKRVLFVGIYCYKYKLLYVHDQKINTELCLQ